jgi:rsbT antagonist protein RsbS
MSGADPPQQEPLRVSILAQGAYLIASIHAALDDENFERFQHDLVERIAQKRSRGVIIDVAALDVLDSFGSRTLRDLGQVARLRGAETVVVGIQPEVAFAMVKFGINLDSMHTVLDLEEGLELLDELCRAGVRP